MSFLLERTEKGRTYVHAEKSLKFLLALNVPVAAPGIRNFILREEETVPYRLSE